MKRTLSCLLTLFVVLVFVFVAARLTGNPFEVMYPEGLEQSQLDAYNAKYGLDRSYPEQFVRYLINIMHGDFGVSLTQRIPVTQVVLSKAAETFRLGIFAFLISIPCGVLLGIVMAVDRDGRPVKITDQILSLIYAVPGFIKALLLLLLFSYWLHLLPSQAGNTPAHYVLPVICLSLGPIISLSRYVRNGILDTLNQDYIRTAVAKGIGKKKIILHHAFRNALIPTLTQISNVIVDIIGGSLVIEQVFTWPGLGSVLVDAVLDRDFPVIQFAVLLLTGIVVLVNYLLDILYMIADPRIGAENG